MDCEWRRLERAWLADPDDQVALRRAISARRRAGAVVSGDMLERRVEPASRFHSRHPLRVWALEPGAAAPREVGRTGYASRPISIPRHRHWWVQPATRITDLELVAV